MCISSLKMSGKDDSYADIYESLETTKNRRLTNERENVLINLWDLIWLF